MVYLRNLNTEPGVPSAEYNQYLYGYTKDLSASGSDPFLASGGFPLDVVAVKEVLDLDLVPSDFANLSCRRGRLLHIVVLL